MPKIPTYGNYLHNTNALDILFLSNHNIHKSLHGLCLLASDTLIDKLY